ncbi:MAG TPA: TIGR02300 family protein [Caulobacteraceae bacterium]|nr:TIGR02300 family protein [Caulobacteraceae bacterium]
MANPELGAKQICPNCSTKFYDLTRRPAHCPKCGTDFDPEEALRNRRVRARTALPEDEVEEEKVPVVAESEDGFEAEPEEAPELDEVADEPPLVTDEDEDAEPGAGPAGEEDIGVDFAEDDLEDADDDEVPFLEDEDDDFSEDEIDGLPDEGDTDDR